MSTISRRTLSLLFVVWLATVSASADDRAEKTACILIWLDGGPPTFDMWDVKPLASRIQTIETAGDVEIGEHFPNISKVMDKLSVVRSMSTREADHGSGRSDHFILTSFVPNPNIAYPSFGAVISRELAPRRDELELPGWVAINGPCGNAGFLGPQHGPLVVDTKGNPWASPRRRILTNKQIEERQPLLDLINDGFQQERRPWLADRAAARSKLLKLSTTKQISAFRIDKEEPAVLDAYGDNQFGRGLVLARRLVERQVPFVSVRFPLSFEYQNDYSTILRDEHFPMLDKGVAALVRDLESRDMWDDVVVLVTGGYSRAPNRAQNVWARSWSLLIGGGGLKGGGAVGATNETGTSVVTRPLVSGNIWATIAHTMGISLDIIYKSPRGRPVAIANGRQPIQDLIVQVEQ